MALALVLLFTSAIGFERAAQADVYFVATPEQLQAAIDDAQTTLGPDTIHLAATVFHIDSSTIGTVGLGANGVQGPNGITLIDPGASATILQGGGPADLNHVVAIFGTSLMTIEGVTIENGGMDGIYDNGNLVLRDSVVRNNGQTGIETVNRGLAIFGSTISGNAASLTGNFGEGGIYVESNFSAVNSTISGNHAAGIFVDFTNRGASLTNVTIDGNAGAGLDVHAAITITNAIVANNAGGDCAPSPPSRAVSGGHNLVGDLTCGFAAAGDLGGVSPKLGPLQNNGGPTPTLAPAADSPAIDAADGVACPVIDQRGIARPQGAACDIGAFELVPNGLPTCVDYGNSTFMATPFSDAVACSDPDAGDTFTLAQVSGPSNGVLTLNPDGTFTYVPSSGFTGSDSFTFQATDSRGALSNIATATITVPDRSPNCPDYTGSVYMDRRLDGSVGCTDPDPGDTVAVSLVSGVSHGILTLAADGTFTYTPASGFQGTDTFTYQATDSLGALSSVAMATISVLSRPPVCGDFTGSVLSGVTLSVGTESNVICTDPDGDTFTYSVVTGPAHGVAFISFRGTGFEYASSRTYLGSDSFTYAVTDMHGIVSNIATATIQVVDTAPTCLNLTGSVGSGGSLPLLQLLVASCSDPDPFDSVTFSFVTGPAHGTLNVAGGLAYLSNGPYLGTDTFTYQATDSRGVVSNVGTATIQVVNTGKGLNVEVFADPAVYLFFRNVVTAGTTTAVSSTTAPALPAGFQIPGGSLYWEISTTAIYAQQGITVCIAAPAGVANPRLLHYQGGAWVDVTTFLNGALVCGSVASLSPFVVAVPVSVSTPTCTASASPGTLWPPNNKFVPVTLSVEVAGGEAGPASYRLVSVSTSEGQASTETRGFTLGTPDTVGELRAARSGNGPGRVYTFTYRATDPAGNTTTCGATVTVPHDHGKN